MYEFMGKLFVSIVIFVVVWCVTVYWANRTTEGWGADAKLPTAFFMSGPILGLITAIAVWIYVPPLF